LPSLSTSALEGRVYDSLDNNQGMYPPAQVLAMLNEGLFRLNIICGLFQAIIPVPGFSVAGQLEYDVPTGILIPLRVYLEGRELEKTSLTRLGDKFRDWTGETSQYNGPVQRWAPVGTRKFVVHPREALGGQMLKVEGIVPSVPLSTPGYSTQLDDQFSDILTDHAKTRVLMKLGGKQFSDASLTRNEMVRKLKALTVWTGMKFPRYWILKETEPDEARGL
jgi:hypothetical protein